MPSWVAAGDPKYDIWMTHTPQGSINDNLSGVGPHGAPEVLVLRRLDRDVHALRHAHRHAQPPRLLRRLLERLDGRRAPRQPHWIVGGPEKYPPIIARGVLLDIAGLHGVDCLPDGYAITPTTSRRRPASRASSSRRGASSASGPGRMTNGPTSRATCSTRPGSACPRRSPLRGGGRDVHRRRLDSLEVMPAEEPRLPPGARYMFATAGAQIIESWLEEIAAEKQYEFAFIGARKLSGATGAPSPSRRGAAEELSHRSVEARRAGAAPRRADRARRRPRTARRSTATLQSA